MSVNLQYNKTHQIFLGTQVGIFKKCVTNKRDEKGKTLKELANLKDVSEIESGSGITALAWKDETQENVLLAQSNGRIKTYNTSAGQFLTNFQIPNFKARIIGLTTYNGMNTTVAEDGELKIWKSKKKVATELSLGGHVSDISTYGSDLLASAGKENCVKIWDMNKGVAIFTAKNEPNDALQLAVPKWESGLTFMPNEQNVIASCSRYGQVRFYDKRTQRKPISITECGLPLTKISASSKRGCVIAGATNGTMKLVDLNKPKAALNTYKDFAGSVVDIACDKVEPYICSISLDRFLRIHHLETKKLLYKVYLKSKPSVMLLRDIKLEPADSEEELDAHDSGSEDDFLNDLPTIS